MPRNAAKIALQEILDNKPVGFGTPTDAWDWVEWVCQKCERALQDQGVADLLAAQREKNDGQRTHILDRP